jgi:hypothetical protein
MRNFKRNAEETMQLPGRKKEEKTQDECDSIVGSYFSCATLEISGVVPVLLAHVRKEEKNS